MTTTKVRTSLKRLSAGDVHQYGREGTEFEAASMSGHFGYDNTGRMEPNLAKWYRQDRERGIAYTVLSYSTPIAWLLRSSGKWVVPSASYSMSSSRHIGICCGLPRDQKRESFSFVIKEFGGVQVVEHPFGKSWEKFKVVHPKCGLDSTWQRDYTRAIRHAENHAGKCG